MNPSPAERRLVFTRALPHALLGVLLAWVALRILYACIYRIDSDEPQHLHVVWCWTQGELAYRDFFDNHAPLFSLLCAPLFRILGERPDIIVPMRLAMIPLVLLSLACVYRIGCELVSRTWALWATAQTAFQPGFFTTSVEFRPDNLWAALWLLAIATLVGGPLTKRRAFLAGLILGGAMGVSMKTSFLLGPLGIAALVTIVVQRCLLPPVAWRQAWVLAGYAVLGGLLIPGALMAWFTLEGALRQFFYCTVEHNLLAGAGRWAHLSLAARLTFPVTCPCLCAAAFGIVRVGPAGNGERRRRLRFAFILLTTGFYLAALVSYCPVLTREDYLPITPLVWLVLTGVMLWLGNCWARPDGLPDWSRHVLPALALAAGLTTILLKNPPWENRTAEPIRQWTKILRLTDPGQYVMDGKGETIFRPRLFYYVLERLTLDRISRGLIVDDIAARLEATQTAVASEGRLPDAAAAFVRANYVPVFGRVRVLGMSLGRAAAGQPLAFNVKVAARYVIVARGVGPVVGQLDSTAFSDPRRLEAGPHRFIPATDNGELVLFWAQAWERGFSAFHVVSDVPWHWDDEDIE